MSEGKAEPAKADGPLARVVDGVKLPAVKAGQIVNEIADQAPLYGLSGAILAVGLVTGRRALARTGARMLTSQVIAALARAATDRLLPLDNKADGKTATEKAAPAEAVAPQKAEPAAEPPAASTTTKVATGAALGIAAAVGGGWLLSRLVKRKPADKDAPKD